MMWGDHWYGMVLGPLFMILALATAIAIAALLVRWLGAAWQGPSSPPPGRTPLDILKERFARGEISKFSIKSRDQRTITFGLRGE
jgi:putative membrane protein